MADIIVKPERLATDKVVEIEETGEVSSLYSVAYRLKESDKAKKVLIVPTNYTKRAMKICKEIGAGITVRNLTGSFRESTTLKDNVNGNVR
jgi:hypothetical protein